MGIINAECGKTFRIAYQGENKRQQVRFDLADIMGEFPGGTAVLAVLRNGDADPVPAAETAMDGTALIWTVTAWECALEGFLYAQVTYASGETVAKTKVYRFDVKNSLVVNGAEPEDWQDLVGQLVEAADGVNSAISSAMDTLDAKVADAQAAQNAAEIAQGKAEDAQAAAETAVGQYDDMTAEAEGLAAGEDPTAEIDHMGDHPVLKLGIPAGEKGDPGDPGDPGAPGYSPVAVVTKSGKVATITLIDKNGTTSAQISDGEDGTTAIDDTAGAGDTDKTFSADKLTAMDSELKNHLTELKTATAEEKTVSETNDIETTMHDGYLAQTGKTYETGSYLNYGYTDKIAVQTGDVIKGYNGSTALQDILVLCEYNGDSFVSGYNPKSFPYTVPEGVTDIAVSANTTYKSTLRLTLTRTETVLVPVLTDRVSAVENLIDGKVDKDGSSQVHAKNCQFMVYSRNLYDESKLTIGLLNKNTGAVLQNYTDYRTSDWIEVEGSENYIFSCSNANGITVYLCWYKSDKTYVSGEETSIAPTLLKTAPSNAKYIRFSILNAHREYKVQFENGSTATDYMKYGTGYLLPEYAPVINENFIMNLPSKVYALAGTEMNIYFDNLVEGHDEDYEWGVTCSTQSVGMQLERGYRVVASTAGTYTLTFTAKRKSDGSSVTKSTSLIIVGASVGSGNSASVIILGDSTTDGGIAVSKIHENLSNDGMTVTTLGTRGTSPNNHEGRSGWRFSFYFTKASETYTDGRGTIYNPFYNPNTQTFDANYYFTNSGIEKPDYFFINLGINDMFGAMSDLQLDSAIEPAIEYCDDMIESVQDASPSTKVCVCLTIPPNYSQDAFGREYKTGQNRNRYKRNNLLWVKRLMEEYEDRENEGIYVIPINLALDTRYNMGFDTQPVNARNTDITYSMPIANGGVHPATSGYWQIADVYTAFLKGNA